VHMCVVHTSSVLDDPMYYIVKRRQIFPVQVKNFRKLINNNNLTGMNCSKYDVSKHTKLYLLIE